MPTHQIDHSHLAQVAGTDRINATHIVGQPGGWAVQICIDEQEHILTAQRSGNARLFKKLETLVGYLQTLGIEYFEVDTSGYDPQLRKTYQRPDRAQALKRAHEAAAYETWFNAQIEASLQDPTPVTTDEEARRLFAARRAALNGHEPKNKPITKSRP